MRKCLMKDICFVNEKLKLNIYYVNSFLFHFFTRAVS